MPLDIISCGAVTAVGLTAPQTCAAIRAGISGYRDAYLLPPPDDPLIGAPVPARKHLRRTPSEWLINLAARAIDECFKGLSPSTTTTIFVNLPEANREHPAFSGMSVADFARSLQERLPARIVGQVFTLQAGHAGALSMLERARGMIARGEAKTCIVGGADTLVNERDITRLRRTYRIREPENAHGVIPGEGAAFVAVTTADSSSEILSRILGVGVAQEKDTVLGARFSQGRGLQAALGFATKDSGVAESTVAFRVSDNNGERYHAWESLLAATRFYRTRRDRLPSWYTAAAVGDIGAAAGALNLIVAATAFSRGYAPGPVAMCEASSDEGLRAACLIGSPPTGKGKKNDY